MTNEEVSKKFTEFWEWLAEYDTTFMEGAHDYAFVHFDHTDEDNVLISDFCRLTNEEMIHYGILLLAQIYRKNSDVPMKKFMKALEADLIEMLNSDCLEGY